MAEAEARSAPDTISRAPPPSAAPVAPSAMPRVRWRGQSFIPLVALAVAVIIVVLFTTQWDRWVGISVRQVTDDAYVRGDITPLSAKVEGYVTRVAVDAFDRVKAGDVLVEIDQSDYRARVWPATVLDPDVPDRAVSAL